MDHVEARQLLSARMDGELPSERAPSLDAHLQTCDECRAFAAGAARLHALIKELPRLAGPEISWVEPVRVRRSPVRLVPAFAAAVAIAVVMTILGPPATFAPPIAAAAERLTTIRTLFVDRTITTAAGTSREKIWFRAPGHLRIERTTATAKTVEIDRPGERYTLDQSGAVLETGLPPSADILPEPLSPTIELLGDPKGSGPTIVGIPTVRYDLTFDQNITRTAYVASNYVALGAEESIVLQKETPGTGSTTTKRVTALQVNQPLDPSLFDIPSIPVRDAGFRPAPLSSFAVPPAAIPAGFTLVSSGASPEGSVALFARGALSIELDVSSREPSAGPTGRSIGMSIGSIPATIIEDLYALPRITFVLGGRQVTIVAPLDRAGLVEIAQTMFAIPE